ncbi:MAG: YihA family ribosome biogenesis GTP-binding protein [Flavobacteriaceae bacterium]|nr:YihA family ribosome biogenesis GTP-binding protein [Flavobacteriaceae bacterium]
MPQASFVKSSTKLIQCPETQLPEVAFIGRSNVGKSSLINMLCEKKGMAKTSSTPGKTQHINHYLIDEKWHLVDLPGYGYARVSKTERAKFEDFISEYIRGRGNLCCVFVLIDPRIPPQQIDLDFINWLGKNNIPIGIVFTKVDKLKKEAELIANIDAFKAALFQSWESLPELFLTSAEKKTGKGDLWDYINSIVKNG